jgi:hypothetical protein
MNLPSLRESVKAKHLIHPLSALILMAIDALWTMVDWNVMTLLFTVPLSFIAVALPTYFIQRSRNQDPQSKALSIAALLGILAAIPTPIMGTFVGGLILTWSGLNLLRSQRR